MTATMSHTSAIAASSASSATAHRLAFIRPTLLFLAAFALNSTPHEVAHALCAYFLGFSSTVFQLWVNPDAAVATPAQTADIALAGPIFSLIVGIVFGSLYLRLYRHKPSGLFFLLMAVIGLHCFLGPASVTALGGGDFGTAFRFLGTPAAITTTISVVGAVVLATLMFWFGKEIMRWVPQNYSHAAAVLSTTVAPLLLGPPLIIAIYWPLPKFLIGGTIIGQAFWFFTVLGAVLARKQPRAETNLTRLHSLDFAMLAIALVMVRALSHGLRLVP